MNLDQLHKREIELLAVTAADGPLEERIEENKKNGVYDDWNKVVESYAGLMPDPVHGNEALKRALFLVWFSYNSPAMENGLGELCQELEDQVLNEIEKRIGSDGLDPETQAMLREYGEGLPFELHPDLFRLNIHLDQWAWPTLEAVEFAPMANRGWMGRFWAEKLEEKTGSQPTEAEPALNLTRDTVPACPVCSRPVNPLEHYCPACGNMTGQFTNYMPYEEIPNRANFFERIWKPNWNNNETDVVDRWVRRLPLLLWAAITSPAWLPIFLVAVLPYLIWDRFQRRKSRSSRQA